MRWIACIVTAFFTSVAHAAITPDPTGLWFDPAETGWGLGVAQQGDTDATGTRLALQYAIDGVQVAQTCSRNIDGTYEQRGQLGHVGGVRQP
ncbi:MAG TPA: hypothetical protein VHQ02_03725 [Usitatibacter sp.]|jgi:hypothetical protein|nr:hypothetical protein [Usitatibacter sp.]